MAVAAGSETVRPQPGELMLHPVVVAAVAVLLVNDHVLKEVVPGVVTGKLSDVAGLLFFPVMLLSIWELARGRACSRPRLRLAAAMSVLTGAVFAATNLFPLGGEVYAWALGAVHGAPAALLAAATGEATPTVIPVSHTVDPTDLVALPALLVGPSLQWPRVPNPKPSRPEGDPQNQNRPDRPRVAPGPSAARRRTPPSRRAPACRPAASPFPTGRPAAVRLASRP